MLCLISCARVFISSLALRVAAQYALGQLYLTDDAEVHDTELGIQWLEYAAHQPLPVDLDTTRDSRSWHLLLEDTANVMEQSRDGQHDRRRLQIMQGHVSAQYGLGKLLLSDDPEVRDTELAIQTDSMTEGGFRSSQRSRKN